ncbi:hypothetical protein QBC38DRAFT_450942 [Podospora fimiseda]|uniref:SUZ domain-containing protein n=1 Tax=Podospora fimiseda TaxID=252190 RepID=A0AAN7BYF6_9PEZI|nr:hypothetical protein QBC38DRAFT_450942 [Podospora fimiseda]
MPNPKSKIPDAWDDDDWETQADKLALEESTQPKEPAPEPPLSKQEREARHREEMRKIWESAEAPPEPPSFFLPTTSNVPLALTTPMKPAVKLLSRKPAGQNDDADEESEVNKKIETLEEIKERQERELAEKKQKYLEARARIFAESSNDPSSGQSSPGTVTPPQQMSEGGRQNSRGRGGRGRGNGRGGGGGRGDYNGNSNNGRQQQHGNRRQQQPAESPQTEQPTRQLYDPNYSPKGGANTPRRSGGASPQVISRSHTPHREEDQQPLQPFRSPRGPDGSGRGGFGFARRGGGANGPNQNG